MISFLNLEYFLLLSERLNFNTTAKELHITQQTLSGHINKLEKSLGVKLFLYGPPLKITSAGILLKTYASEILSCKRKMEESMFEMQKQKSGTITIGTTYSRAQFLLPPIIRDFKKKYPLVQIKLFEGNTPEVEAKLVKHEVDVAIGFQPANLKNVLSIPLYHDPFMLVIHPAVLEQYFPDRPSHQFRIYNDQAIKDIIQCCPFLIMPSDTTVGKYCHQYISDQKLHITKILELRDVGTMLSMCYSQMGFMLCPRTLIQCSAYPFSKEHIIHPLPDFKPLMISVNYSEHQRHSSLIKSFIKIVKENLSNSLIPSVHNIPAKDH